MLGHSTEVHIVRTFLVFASVSPRELCTISAGGGADVEVKGHIGKDAQLTVVALRDDGVIGGFGVYLELVIEISVKKNILKKSSITVGYLVDNNLVFTFFFFLFDSERQ